VNNGNYLGRGKSMKMSAMTTELGEDSHQMVHKFKSDALPTTTHVRHTTKATLLGLWHSSGRQVVSSYSGLGLIPKSDHVAFEVDKDKLEQVLS
jgi:hypothetical protein